MKTEGVGFYSRVGLYSSRYGNFQKLLNQNGNLAGRDLGKILFETIENLQFLESYFLQAIFLS